MLTPLLRAYRRFRFGPPIIVVSGLPRSGTSMAMRMLTAAGLRIVSDGRRTADTDNPHGYFEDARVMDLGRDADLAWLRSARGGVIKVISHLVRELPPTHNYKVILMNRNVDEVLASQRKMLERRGEPSTTDDATMKELLEADLWKARYRLRSASFFEMLELGYGEVVADPRAQAQRLRDFLGGDLDVDEMAKAVDPSLYRNRS